MIVTREYLRTHLNHIFVFGDNLTRRGYGGAAELRDEPNTYGFITKKYPGNDDMDFYKPEEYQGVFASECLKLNDHIYHHKDSLYLISRIGAGLANRFGIYEEIIQPQLSLRLGIFSNVQFLEVL